MDELIKMLRTCAERDSCIGWKEACPYLGTEMCDNKAEKAADAIEELSKPRWIPVEERLPETGVDVLVMFPHNMAVASRDMGEWVVNSGDGWCTDVNLSDDEKEPTHWMPLPEPPKEEKA